MERCHDVSGAAVQNIMAPDHMTMAPDHMTMAASMLQVTTMNHNSSLCICVGRL